MGLRVRGRVVEEEIKLKVGGWRPNPPKPRLYDLHFNADWHPRTRPFVGFK